MVQTGRGDRGRFTSTGLRRLLAPGVALALLLAVTGCTGAEQEPRSAGTSPAAVATTSASADTSSTPAAGDSPDPAAPSSATPGGATVRLSVGERDFALHLPPSPPTEPTALVVALHGYTGTASDALNYFGLRQEAAERGYLLATPQGLSDQQGNPFWNASRACCNLFGAEVDDAAFLRGLIEAVDAAHSVDPARVYVVGHSNGGFMALRMACEHADLVTAVVSVAGAMDVGDDCDPSQPVSVLQVHGDADDTIAITGGQIMNNRYTSAEQTVGWWRERNACTGDPEQGDQLDVDAVVSGDETATTRWQGCEDDTAVELWQIAGGGHVPGLTQDFAKAMVDWLDEQER